MDKKLTLLAVDDDKGLLGQLRLRYREFFEVLTASSLEEAKEIVSEKNIDICLVDVRLDESDPDNTRGLELVNTIRKNHQNSIIIMMSRYNEGQYRRQALHAGSDGFIRKPFTVDQFIDLTAKYIKQKNAVTTAD